MSLLNVEGLGISLRSDGRWNQIVKELSFDVAAGEILCIVGESGSGKSMTAKALMGLLPRGARTSGRAMIEGQPLLGGGAEKVRGRMISMIFQEPMTALNPVLTIGRQMTESSVIIGGISQTKADERASALLERVGIGEADARLRQYPHEFSGGMRQRVMIAMALMSEPKLMIADEPTTALDVSVQSGILQLMRQLVDETGMGLILITHDMGVVAEMADKVVVMRHGKSVETAPVAQLFGAPENRYTKALLAAVPRLDSQAEAPTQSVPAPLMEARNLRKTFRIRSGLFGKPIETRALDDVSIAVGAGEALALVGESGSGKSTFGRAITRLVSIDAGELLVDGQNISALEGRELRAARARAQMIFQDPYSSLDPRFSIGATVDEPMVIRGKTRAEARDRTEGLLRRVGLEPDLAARYPHEFSGGQRQRIAIARALATDPDLLVADEPTSALDVSIQAQILELLSELKVDRSLALLFISHDLAVVRQIADRVAVMRRGRIVETGQTADVLSQPRHSYTRMLLDAAPVPDPNRRRGMIAPAPDMTGEDGPLHEVAPGHWVAA
ncbi:MAG: ABC transporter ATP-binding protein [Pseudomonadota bacterium]